MLYRTCECKKNAEELSIVILDDSVTEKEITEYYANLKRLDFFRRIEFFMKMIRYNGYILEKHIRNASAMNGQQSAEALELANKYAFDFAASIGSFIEFIEKRLMQKQSEQIQNEFSEFRKTIFKDNIYKFWYYFRNYAIHYEVPFTSVNSQIEENKLKTSIICKRDHLLRYKEWKHATEYVQSLPEDVDICEMIEPVLVKMHAYYLGLLFIFRDEIVDVHRHVEQFILRHKARTGIALMAYDTETDLVNNRNGRMHDLHIRWVAELLADLTKHPNVEITYTQL